MFFYVREKMTTVRYRTSIIRKWTKFGYLEKR
ncbi:hypothetical protein BY457_12047 [Marinilabilia salmonicolor]|nr:hypothetical protein BY457_12047 [Marinilabilia salmonicolor]